MTNPLQELANYKQSPWYDMISREMIASGELARLIEEEGLMGVTSNPTIFDKAISSGSDYDSILKAAIGIGISEPKALFERLAVADIRDACDILKPIYDRTNGEDGYVSLEVSPTLAYDTAGTVAEARRLFDDVGKPNVMIKIPATKEGLPAIEETIAAGINVNVTLIFSIERYMQVITSYLNGLERLAASGGSLDKVASVASFFVSRIDAAVEKQLPEGHELRGRVAIANAKVAYGLFSKIFSSERFEKLKGQGARVQRPLWASTGTKNPAYSDVLYVDELIAADTVNTIPPATWKAFLDHGKLRESGSEDIEGARLILEALDEAGVNLQAITQELEEKGVKAFADSFDSLLRHLAEKAQALANAPATDAAPEPQTAPEPAAVPETAAEPQAPAESAPEQPAASAPGTALARIWNKDAALWKEDPAHQAVIQNSLGWLDLPETMASRIDEIAAFAQETRNSFDHVVVLGMGGSSLAPLVFSKVFGKREGYPALHVLDSTDPGSVLACESAAPPERTLYVVASKSGTTVEPSRLFDYFWSKVSGMRPDSAGGHFVAITDPATALEQLASQRGFRKTFLNPADIGGRFSALSFFGLVPAALAGVDTAEVLQRAREAAARSRGPQNPAQDLATVLTEQFRAGRDKITFLASPGLESFGLWLEQLIAESTGKEGKGIVPLASDPKPESGAYGPDRLFVQLRLENADNTALEAFGNALTSTGQPLVVVSLKDQFDLGAEFFRWELTTALIGHSLGINPFDQPNVQSAKDQTQNLLQTLQSSGSLPAAPAQVADAAQPLGFSQAAWRALGENAANAEDALSRFSGLAREGEYFAVLAYLNSDGRYDAPLRSLSRALSENGRAVQTGYGPRYLHSTGQLHKGGPDNGVFFILVESQNAELPIPGQPYTFNQLASAQALGDFQALEASGRRTVFIPVSGDVAGAIGRLQTAVTAQAVRA